MGKIVWGVIGGLVAVLVVAVVMFGREATVWGAADAAPAPVRTITASILRGATTPMALVEEMTGAKFGAIGEVSELAGCGQSDACVREKEQYLPEKELLGTKGSMNIEPDGSCTFWAAVGGGKYVATQIGLLFKGEDGQAFATASVPVAAVSMGPSLPYEVDDAACVFARNNTQAFGWELLSAKGFAHATGQPKP
jgi:hypothetical protein